MPFKIEQVPGDTPGVDITVFNEPAGAIIATERSIDGVSWTPVVSGATSRMPGQGVFSVTDWDVPTDTTVQYRCFADEKPMVGTASNEWWAAEPVHGNIKPSGDVSSHSVHGCAFNSELLPWSKGDNWLFDYSIVNETNRTDALQVLVAWYDKERKHIENTSARAIGGQSVPYGAKRGDTIVIGAERFIAPDNAAFFRVRAKYLARPENDVWELSPLATVFLAPQSTQPQITISSHRVTARHRTPFADVPNDSDNLIHQLVTFRQDREEMRKVQREIMRSQTELVKLNEELLFSNIFRDSIVNSNWLRDKTFSPYRGAANYSFLYKLYKIYDVLKPTRILEFGLGQTTKLTLQYVASNSAAEAFVVEHDDDWINVYTATFGNIPVNVSLIHIPLEARSNSTGTTDDAQYSSRGLVDEIGSRKFDLIIVDGPIGWDKEYPRTNILDLVDHLAENFIVIFDDAERDGERRTIALFQQLLASSGVAFESFAVDSIKRQWFCCAPNIVELAKAI